MRRDFATELVLGPWRTRLVVLAVAVALCGGVSWCAKNTVSCEETCTFASKRFVPEHTDHWTTMECMSRDSHGNCNIRIPVSHSRFVAEAWFATFLSCEGATHEVQVDERFYNEPRAAIHVHIHWKRCPCQ